MRLRDQTDWWSISNESFRQANVKAKNENIVAGTFEIAGVDLGSDQFRKLATKMGKAPIIERGDASTGRQQVCYIAADGPVKIYLIFEFGEDDSAFYLFSDGGDWIGQRLCVRIRQVSMSLGTSSGLRLGLTRAEVEAILGKADAAFGDRSVYSREVQKKTTPAEFEKLREEYPEPLSDKVAHEEFDFHPIDMYVEARFGKSGMSYPAVSQSSGVK